MEEPAIRTGAFFLMIGRASLLVQMQGMNLGLTIRIASSRTLLVASPVRTVCVGSELDPTESLETAAAIVVINMKNNRMRRECRRSKRIRRYGHRAKHE